MKLDAALFVASFRPNNSRSREHWALHREKREDGTEVEAKRPVFSLHTQTHFRSKEPFKLFLQGGFALQKIDTDLYNYFFLVGLR